MPTSATITIALGERVITLPLQDPRSLGFLANGCMNETEEMFDGRGHLIHLEEAPFASDLLDIGIAARDLFREIPPPDARPTNQS